MEIIFFPILILLSLLYAVIAILCGIYVYMGMRQLATGYKEKNRPKKSNGLIALLLSLGILLAASYAYFSCIGFF